MLTYDFENSVGFWVMTTAHEYQRAVNEELAPTGITYRQCQVLGFLALEGPLPQAELAERMQVEPATLVGILDRMERDGWIKRLQCKIDRRRKLIHPQRSAKPVWTKIVACVKRVRARATQEMKVSELATLKRSLGRVRKNLQHKTLSASRAGSVAQILAFTSTLLFTISAPLFAQSPKAPTPLASRVFVATTRIETLDEPKSFVGTVMPLRKSTVGSAAPGRVEEYLVNEGDFIKKGAPIAHLRRGIIGAEKRAAEAELEVRKAALAEMENSHQDEIDQAKAQLAVAEAHWHFQQSKAERAKQLLNTITKEALEEALSLEQQAAATRNNATSVVRLISGNAWEQRREQARAKVAVQQAEVERFSEQFDRHTMFAPFDGWVTAEFTEVGQWLMQGDKAAEIVELGSVDIEIAVLEDYISKLTPGVIGDVEVNALKGQRFVGTVAIMNPQADARARTFPVKVRVNNVVDDRGPLLKAGMFARVTLPVGEPKPLPLIPKDAISIGGLTPVVFVIASTHGKSTVRPVPVTLGVAHGQWVSVGANELKAGDVVVVEGNERLRPGQEVRAEPIQISFP